MTGVTAAEVCTDEGKKLILEAVAEALKVKVEQLLVSKCADTTGRRRSLLAAGVDLEYQVTLTPAEAKEKQAEIVKTMATLEGESEATTSVLAAVAKATGKDVSTFTVQGSNTVVTVDKAVIVVSDANTTPIGDVSIIVATIVFICFIILLIIIWYRQKVNKETNKSCFQFYCSCIIQSATDSQYQGKQIEAIEMVSPLAGIHVPTKRDMSIQQKELWLFLNQQNLDEYFDRLTEDSIQCINDLEHVSVHNFITYGLNEAAAKDAMKKIKLYEIEIVNT